MKLPLKWEASSCIELLIMEELTMDVEESWKKIKKIRNLQYSWPQDIQSYSFLLLDA